VIVPPAGSDDDAVRIEDFTEVKNLVWS